MAVDLIARALALKAAGGGSGGSGFAKEADFNAPGFMPEENTYYIYKDSGIEPVIEYKPFVVGEILPSGSLIHIHPDKQDELAAFIDGLTDGQAGFFVVLGTKPNGGIMFQHLAAGEGVNILVYTDIVSQKLIPIYSSAETDINKSGLQIHITKGFQNLDNDNNFILDYGDDEWSVTMLSYGPDPTIFDNLDWNGKIISWAEAQTGSKYQDGIVYLYQDGQYHEIGPQGVGDDAPIINADFYAKDFTPKNGRFYRQVGASKYIGPIEHEQGSRNLTLYFDMFMPFEDMVYALEGLERDEVPPMSETEGLKMWAMVGDQNGGSFSSISILHVPANAEGMACDKDFWQIGIFGGLFSLWNSETYQMQVEQGKPSQTVVKGWHESMSGQTFIVDGKMVMTGADYYVFNTQYWNAFTSTEPIKEATKNTIAKYHDNAYDEVALKSDMDNLVSDEELAEELSNIKLNEYHFTLSFPGQTGSRDNVELLLYRVCDICWRSSDGNRIYSIDLSGGYSSTLGDIHLIRIVNPQIIFDDSSSMPSMFVIKSAAFSYSYGMDQYNIADATFYVRSRTAGQYEIKCTLSMNGSEANFNVNTVSVGYFAKYESYPDN